MHEQSLVRDLLAQVRETAASSAGQVEEVLVAIGPLSGVEPLLVASAFEQLTQGTEMAGARLVIEETPLRLACRDCGAEFETGDIDFACPRCRSCRTRVVAGEHVILRSLVVCEPQSEEIASWPPV
ncbi:MAG TPA: hydrogenase maturation nickel metallochaperone HypA [Pirellulaceae bacterium]|nr:hydrogenase maturation nickel metallochaperone HypA [Pirellulaceae bacterium]